MEFNDSGLPLDTTIFKAFKTHSDFIAGLPREEQSDYAVRVAKLLAETVGSDATLLSVALLTPVPKTMHGVLEKRFGTEITDLVREADRHMRTGQAHLMHASDPIKLLSLASAIISFDEYTKGMEQSRHMIEQMEEGNLPPGPLPILMMPDTTIYDRLAKSVFSNVEAPALEELYNDKLLAFKMSNEDYVQKLKDSGLMPEDDEAGNIQMSGHFPDFDETGLLDDPKVRAAYEILTQDTRVMPEDFEGALHVGHILTTYSNGANPTAVAAALLDVGIRGLVDDDFDMLQNQIDWDVIELLRHNSIHMQPSATTLMKAPVEFRQIAFANMLAVLQDAHEAAIDIVQAAKDNPQLPPTFLMQNLRPIAMAVMVAEKTIMPAFGTSNAPQIETLLAEKSQELRAFLGEIAPKSPKPATPPAPPKRGKDEFGFDK